MSYDAVPVITEYTNKALLGRLTRVLGRKISIKTMQRWRSRTGLTKEYLSNKDVWRLAIYGNCAGIYRNPDKALREANRVIKELTQKTEQSNGTS